MCVCIGFVQYIQDRLTACLFISSDCCFHVYTFFFARSTGNISCCAAGICVQFMYDFVRLLFIGAVFSIGFSFIRPSYYCCCVCLLNAVKLAASSPLSLSAVPIAFVLCSHFYCISNAKIHSKSICWLGAASMLCLVIVSVFGEDLTSFVPFAIPGIEKSAKIIKDGNVNGSSSSIEGKREIENGVHNKRCR